MVSSSNAAPHTIPNLWSLAPSTPTPGSLRQEVLQLQLSAKTALSYKGNPGLRFTSTSLSLTSTLSITPTA